MEKKAKFGIVNSGELNWEYVLQYQKLHNESPHSSLGFLTPFEVYFGRPQTQKQIVPWKEKQFRSSKRKLLNQPKILMNLPKRKSWTESTGGLQ